MTITCPHCAFAKEVDPANLPDKPLKVTCPRCKEVFSFQKPVDDDASVAADPAPVAETPAVAVAPLPTPTPAAAHQLPAVAPVAVNAALLPKAGFWIRFVAVLIDSLLVTSVQAVFGLALSLIGSGMANQELLVGGVSFMFGSVVSVAYYVFFTGYCGQTPGKMALRIKVIRTDGNDLSYGRAFLREAVGKFISALILFIGYLMAAFDSQKQGLHDRMADTYVIKL